jgi:hypothetical protein
MTNENSSYIQFFPVKFTESQTDFLQDIGLIRIIAYLESWAFKRNKPEILRVSKLKKRVYVGRTES